MISNKLPLGKQDFKYFIGYKHDKKLDLYTFDKNNCMYFMIKEEKCFDKYNELWEKVSNTIKELIVNLYTIKNI